MLKYTTKGMNILNQSIRSLENVGSKVLSTSRTMAVGGRASKMAAPFVGTSGRMLSTMGRNPNATIVAGGALGVAALARPTQANMRGRGVASQTRQNTMYNRRMRSGQSSALSGLQPRSMGGYA